MVLASTLGLACSVVGVRSTKEPAYTVVLEDADREIRAYEGYLIARTRVDASYEESGSEGFRRLFRYISGHNSGAREIAMTAPVLQARKGEKIAMTAPVLQERSGDSWTMDFVMPAHFTRETVPQPLDERVRIEQVPARTVAVLRYSGRVAEDDLELRTRQLEEWLAGQPYRAISPAVSARYDPPFAVPFLRRNEIMVPVRWSADLASSD